jgi:hypothetical protein
MPRPCLQRAATAQQEKFQLPIAAQNNTITIIGPANLMRKGTHGTFAFLEDPPHNRSPVESAELSHSTTGSPRHCKPGFRVQPLGILTLAERYSATVTLPLYVLHEFAQFLLALCMPCSPSGNPPAHPAHQLFATIGTRGNQHQHSMFSEGRVGGPLDSGLAAQQKRGSSQGEQARLQAIRALFHLTRTRYVAYLCA